MYYIQVVGAELRERERPVASGRLSNENMHEPHLIGAYASRRAVAAASYRFTSENVLELWAQSFLG